MSNVTIQMVFQPIELLYERRTFMEIDKPFIHVYQCFNKFFLYDVNTHKIIEIPKEIYNLLNEGKYNEYESHPFIKKLIDNGFLKPGIMSCRARDGTSTTMPRASSCSTGT
jgi:hypothetical protein